MQGGLGPTSIKEKGSFGALFLLQEHSFLGTVLTMRV
jgi:hypothetical protein